MLSAPYVPILKQRLICFWDSPSHQRRTSGDASASHVNDDQPYCRQNDAGCQQANEDSAPVAIGTVIDRVVMGKAANHDCTLFFSVPS